MCIRDRTIVFGTSFDADSGVASVSVQIRRHTNLGLEFWDGSEWTSTNLFVTARVFSSGNRWSLPAVDLTTPGAYRIRLQARDNAGNVSLGGANPVTRFTVEAPDTTAPAATISSPEHNDIIAPVLRRIYGTSSDSQSGVKSVSVQVRRRANFTVQYWNGTAWQNESVFVFTDRQAAGTRWNLPRVDLTTPGTYRIRLRADDFNGNVSLGGDNPITFFTVEN